MISVVIPLYNKEKSIKSTIDSVLSQTYKDFEIVVVNDGSTDNGVNVVHGLCERDNRIRLISQRNKGVSSARNKGILAANGEYVAFLDGDDLWETTYLESLVNLIRDYPDATIYGIGYGFIRDGVKIIPQSNIKGCYRGYVNEVWCRYPGCWTGSSSSSSRENLIKIGLFDSRMTHGEDVDMWWRLLLRGKGAIETTTLAWYRQDAENRAMNKLIPLETHIPYFIDKYAEARKQNKDFRKFFDTEMIYRLYPYLFNKDYNIKAMELSCKIDYSQLKLSLKFRMQFPYLYKLYEDIKST